MNRSVASGIVIQDISGKKKTILRAFVPAICLLFSVQAVRAGEPAPLRQCADPDNLAFSSERADSPELRGEIGAAIALGKRATRVTLLAKQCDLFIGLPAPRLIRVAATDHAPETQAAAAEQAAAQPEAKPAADGPALIAEGEEIFNGTCAYCHGPDAVQAERKIDLRLLRHRYGEGMEEMFFKTVTNGRPSKGMPSWKDVFTQAQFTAIFAFLKSKQTE